MKYQLVGKKIPHVGKSLWEIVGNLKNFGVGRLIKKSTLSHFPEPSFFKIIKVLPLPTPESQFEDRNVIVWMEEIYRGVRIEQTIESPENFMPEFSLIPKIEEEKYYKLVEEWDKKRVDEIIPLYTTWPPLYKLIWERNHLKRTKSFMEIPKLKTILTESPYNLKKLRDTGSLYPPLECELYKQDVPVENLIKEIVRLQKIVNAHELRSEA